MLVLLGHCVETVMPQASPVVHDVGCYKANRPQPFSLDLDAAAWHPAAFGSRVPGGDRKCDQK